jgi:hypothetical protein
MTLINQKVFYYKEELVHQPNTILIKILTDFYFVETCANSQMCIKLQGTAESQTLEEPGSFFPIKIFKSFSN